MARPIPHNGASEHVRTTESVVQRIERLIIDQKFATGDRLPPERELATELAVSRNVLREALKVLAQKGLLTVIPGHGTYIATPSPRVVSESLSVLLQLRHVGQLYLCDARLLIEPELAALAAERATDADIAEVKRCLDRLYKTRFDPQAHVEADLAFHSVIAQAANHFVFQSIVEAVRTLVIQSMSLGTQIPRAIDASDGHHRAIFAAISAHDIEAARAAMWGHMAFIQGYIRRLEKASRARSTESQDDMNS
jgi:GntR family transcriptional repressor for pyruvate dehydrogenase complex